MALALGRVTTRPYCSLARLLPAAIRLARHVSRHVPTWGARLLAVGQYACARRAYACGIRRADAFTIGYALRIKFVRPHLDEYFTRIKFINFDREFQIFPNLLYILRIGAFRTVIFKSGLFELLFII